MSDRLLLPESLVMLHPDWLEDTCVPWGCSPSARCNLLKSAGSYTHTHTHTPTHHNNNHTNTHTPTHTPTHICTHTDTHQSIHSLTPFPLLCVCVCVCRVYFWTDESGSKLT